MYAGLMALAVILTVAGVGMVVFGIPINAFSLGNTLIVSGMTAICGGLLLVGLAAAYRQLRRIADALTRAGPRVPRPLDLADPHAPALLRTPTPPTARIPLPREAEGQGEFHAPEAHYQAESRPEPRPAYRAEPRSDYPPEPRPSFRAEARSEPPEYQHERLEIRPERRYAPRDQRPESRYGQPPARSSPADYAGDRQRVRTARDTGDDAGGLDTHAGGPGPRLRLPPSIAAVFGPRPSDASPEADTMSPQQPTSPDQETGAVASRPLVPEESQISQPEPTPPPSPPTAAPDAAETEPEESEFTTVLKSGVVDGLAYTLYADGSIAAELPEGRRRFGSIDELRAHLEQNGG